MARPEKQRRPMVRGVYAPAPRMTRTAAFLIATALSIPVFILLTVGQWIFG